MQALYVHVPFCLHKCHYCDFYSIAREPERDAEVFERFTQGLRRELESTAERWRLRPRTIFAGGGTPTLLPPAAWASLLSTMRSLGLLESVEEFTVEANPETVTQELAATLAAGGVNRVSLGCQSFDPALLQALERWHDPASVPVAIDRLRAAGITNLNLDLIFAIPGQTLAQWRDDLERVLDLGPTHVSCYGLTYEPNTPMGVQHRLGRITATEETVERQMYEHAMDRLDAAGFEHYEVSAWARPDRRCRHNLNYWHNGDWLGVGPGAASHVAGRRWKNQPHLGKYLAGVPDPPRVEVETLTDEQRRTERVMLGLRTSDGVPRAWCDEHELPPLLAAGLLEPHADRRIRLTRRGYCVADAVIERVV